MGLVLKLRLKRPYGAGYNVGGIGLAEGGLKGEEIRACCETWAQGLGNGASDQGDWWRTFSS